MYFLKSLSNEVKSAQLFFNRLSKTKQLVSGAIFASLAALFQSAGGFLPGIGMFISPLSTAPILFCFVLSLPLGFITYILTNLLLLIIQPSELIIFPFTTGILGIGIGAAFYFLKEIVHYYKWCHLINCWDYYLIVRFQIPSARSRDLQ